MCTWELNIVLLHMFINTLYNTNAKIKVIFYLLALSYWGKQLLFGRATFSGDDTESKSMPLLTNISSQLLSQSECIWPHSDATSMSHSLIPIPPVTFPYHQSHSYTNSLIPILSVSFPCHQYNFYRIPMLLV